MKRAVSMLLSLVASAAFAGSDLYPTDYFRSAQFRDAFLASLGVKSDVEPPLNEQEDDYLKQLQPHLERQEEINDCIDTFKGLITADSTARFDYELGMLYFRKGDLAAAEQCLKQAVTRFPRFLRAHQNLGMVLTRTSHFTQAVEHLTQAVALGQADEQLYGLLGYAYMQAQQPLSAETAYRNAIMLGPKSIDWKMGLAQALFKQSKAAEAVALLGELLKDHPEKTELWSLQAAAQLANKAPLEAAKNYELLSMMGKASAENLGTLGDIYLSEGIFPLATSAYLRALQAPSAKPEAAVRATELLAQRGANDEVRQMVAGIQEHAPMLDGALRGKLMKLQARIELAEDAPEAAVKLLEEVHAASPLDGEAILLLADHYGRIGQVERSLFYLERALKVSAVEADAALRMAQAMMKKSASAADKQKRVEAMQRAIELLKRAQELKPREAVGKYLADLERALAKMRGA